MIKVVAALGLFYMILKEAHYYPKEVGAPVPLIFVHPAWIIGHSNSKQNTSRIKAKVKRQPEKLNTIKY